MNKLVKVVCLGLMVLPFKPLSAGVSNTNLQNANAHMADSTANVSPAVDSIANVSTDSHDDTPFDWTPIMDAIILVESEGNPNAVSGNSVGAMQITPILVRECNQILESRGSSLRYTMDDRYDVAKSKEMFLLIQSRYNKENNVEKAIRSWNGGPNYSDKSTNGYYKKVLRRMS